MCGSGFSLDAGSNKCELYRDSFLIVASKNKILGIPYAFFLLMFIETKWLTLFKG
jgi:hypothetical protein